MSDKNIKTNKRLNKLLDIMVQLRDPETGCPWDIEQNFETIAPYTIEEAYEVAYAIEQHDLGALKSELGDLLFQVVFHARLAEEDGAFSFNDVVESISNKLVQRHPHVFSDKKVAKEDMARQWELSKRKEKGADNSVSILDDVNASQPAINRAYKLQKKAAAVGFDWGDVAPVIEKLDEEIKELKDEINNGGSQQRIADELGDVMFTCVNLARHLDLNPEWSLRNANQKFSKRFAYVEQQVKVLGINIEDCSLEQLELLWGNAKNKER